MFVFWETQMLTDVTDPLPTAVAPLHLPPLLLLLLPPSLALALALPLALPLDLLLALLPHLPPALMESGTHHFH